MNITNSAWREREVKNLNVNEYYTYNKYKKKSYEMHINTFFFVFSKYKNDPEQWEKYENSLYALGMLQYPHYKDLSVFVKKNPVIDLPLENISNIMLNVIFKYLTP